MTNAAARLQARLWSSDETTVNCGDLSTLLNENDRYEKAIEQALCCTPHVVDEFGYQCSSHKIEYDCGDPWEILRNALEGRE